MPIRQGGRLARKLSSWLRESLRLSTMAPQLSTPIRWKTFLPISIPITAISELHLADFVCAGMNVLLAVSAPQGRWGPPVHSISGRVKVYTFLYLLAALQNQRKRPKAAGWAYRSHRLLPGDKREWIFPEVGM